MSDSPSGPEVPPAHTENTPKRDGDLQSADSPETGSRETGRQYASLGAVIRGLSRLHWAGIVVIFLALSVSCAAPANTQAVTQADRRNTELTDEVSRLSREVKAAQARAERAEATANRALSMAASAATEAQKAQRTADKAQSTADEAKSTATEALACAQGMVVEWKTWNGALTEMTIGC